MSFHSNSITEHIDEHSVSNRIRFIRRDHLRASRTTITIVVVEGDGADPLIYQGLFNNSNCHIVPASGKKNAISAVSMLKSEGFPGILAIVDDDFDTLNNSKIQHKNIIPTDTHDAECLVINSPALEKFLLHLLPKDKQNFQEYLAKDIRKTIVQLAIPLGYIRWHFSTKDTPVSFSDINFRNFIDIRKRQCSIVSNVREVLSKNGDSSVSEDELVLHVQEKIKNDKSEWWLVCQGHDLVKVLFLLLSATLSVYAPKDKFEQKKYFDSIQPMIETENKIVKYLAMCYEKTEFEKTVMYSRIVDWEKENTPYVIMRQ